MTPAEEREQGWVGTIRHLIVGLVVGIGAGMSVITWQWWVCVGLPLFGLSWEIGMRFATAPRGLLRRFTGKTWYASVRGLMAFYMASFVSAAVTGGWM